MYVCIVKLDEGNMAGHSAVEHSTIVVSVPTEGYSTDEEALEDTIYDIETQGNTIKQILWRPR